MKYRYRGYKIIISNSKTGFNAEIISRAGIKDIVAVGVSSREIAKKIAEEKIDVLSGVCRR